MTYTDILYEKNDGVAWITINQSFNLDSEQRAGVAELASTALHLYYQTDEAMEGRNAFIDKRGVNFRKFRT
jgi:naphthoate synthase